MYGVRTPQSDFWSVRTTMHDIHSGCATGDINDLLSVARSLKMKHFKSLKMKHFKIKFALACALATMWLMGS